MEIVIVKISQWQLKFVETVVNGNSSQTCKDESAKKVMYKENFGIMAALVSGYNCREANLVTFKTWFATNSPELLNKQ